MDFTHFNNMIISFIDSAFNDYKEEFHDDYIQCTDQKLFVEFACHDFLFCTILHGEPNTKYDIRQYYESTFKEFMESDIYIYSKIVEIVVKYFREFPNEACQDIECFKPQSMLKYYCFVFVKSNEDLFIEQHSPYKYDSDNEFNFESGSEFEDD
jgi:hypothetical protein